MNTTALSVGGAAPSNPVRRALPWLCGVAVAAALCRFFFTYGPGEMHVSADGASYVSRLVEFLASLKAGYAFPQWATHFRAGLGSPYFGYYQPGFFYAATVFGVLLPPLPAIGLTLCCFAFLGYAGMLLLVGTRFGTAAGVLAGTTLLLANYSLMEIYQRGDFSEFAGMMTLPVLLHWLIGWLEHGRPWHWRGLALGSGVLVLLHCVAGLLGYGVLALTTLWYAAACGVWARAAWATGALVVGVGVAGFYVVPLALEWDLVQGDNAARHLYAYSRHFVDPIRLLIATKHRGLLPVYMGRVVPALVIVATLVLVCYRRRATPAHWRLVGVLWALVAVAAFMMGPASAGVWGAVPLLPRIQFPWRFLLVLTVAAAALAGSLVAWHRLLVVAGVAALLATTMTRVPHVRPRKLPANVQDIARVYFAPDVAGEWLPRGARLLRGNDVPRAPRCEPSCTVEEFAREPGRLRVRFTATERSELVLPHYFFPVGWQARLDQAPVALEATPEGLMRVRVDRSGVLELTFGMTPMRRLGVFVSSFTLAAWLAAIASGLPGRRRAVGPGGTSAAVVAKAVRRSVA